MSDGWVTAAGDNSRKLNKFGRIQEERGAVLETIKWQKSCKHYIDKGGGAI